MTHLSMTRGLVSGLVLLVGLGLTGCGSNSSDTAVKRAEAQVAAKEKALSDAKATFKASSAAFCTSTRTYITAIDRYGDVLHTTTTTVGDVKDAGSDLVSPRQDAMAAAQQAVADQQAVVDAKHELADAQAALEAAKRSSGGTASAKPSPAPSSATATPLAPAATVNRVKAAESEFESAVNGITDQTPLVRASQEFNAAAVALEMSWLQLFADAGCLTDEQQVQAEAAVREYTTTLQQSLAQAGHFGGKVDGVYGPATVDAVKALQQAHGLPVTGTVDKATEQALESELAKVGGAAAQEAVASTAAVQQTLKLAGFWDGPVDGTWTPELTAALESFQKELGVKPTGAVDAATIAALEAAIAAAGQSPTPTSSSPPTSAPSSPTSSGSASAGG